MLNIAQIFDKHADNNHFILDETNQISTEEINNKSWALAYHISKFQNRIIAFKASSNYRSILYMLSIIKSGKTFLPISPKTSEENIKHIAEQTNALYISDENDDFCYFFEDKFIFNKSNLINNEKYDLSRVVMNDIAYIIFTSGTTGKPKGVCISQENLHNYCKWALAEFKIKKNDKCLVTTSPAFDLSFTSIFPALLTGSNIHICPEDCRTGNALLNIILKNKITFIKSTPSILKTIYKLTNFEKCTSINTLVLGGEKFDLDLAKNIHSDLPNCLIYNHYGPTETTIGCCAQKINFSYNDENAFSLKPITGMKGIILDSNNNKILNNQSGELIVYGKGVGSYLNTESSSFFTYNNEPAFKTGDICHYAKDGGFIIEGRTNSIVKIKGYRVNLNEITHAIKNIKGIINCSVHYFEKNNKFICFYTSIDNIEPQQIKNQLLKTLPSYAIPPIFYKCNNITINTNGKIDFNGLYKNYQNSLSRKRDQFSRILSEYFTFTSLESIIDKPIKYFIDSLDTISLICQIEETYKCQIDISSINTIKDLFSQLKSKRKKKKEKIENLKIESRIVLIGGGENGRPGTKYETEKIDKFIAELTKKSNPKLLFIGIHSSTPESYGQLIRMNFNRFNCDTTILSIKDCENFTNLQNLFHNTDIIYIGGGDTEQLNIMATKYKLKELLTESFTRGCIICGLCSGANYLCKEAIVQIYSQQPTFLNSGYNLMKELGLAPISFCPHYDVEPLRAQVAREIVKLNKTSVIYACENETALILKPNGYFETFKINDKKIYKLYNSNNVLKEKILEDKGFINYDKK